MGLLRVLSQNCARYYTPRIIRRTSVPDTFKATPIIVGCVLGSLFLIFAVYGLVRYWRTFRNRLPESDGEAQAHERHIREREPAETTTSDTMDRSGEPASIVDLRPASDCPPRLQLSPGWPNAPRTEKQSRYALLPLGEYLDESDVQTGRSSPSFVEAVAGSTSTSAAPSRTTSTSAPHGTRKRREKNMARHIIPRCQESPPAASATLMSRHLSIESGWSRRATIRSDGTSDMESLPAYSVLRSRSLASLSSTVTQQRQSSRYSRAQSRRTSAVPPDGSVDSGVLRALSVSHGSTVSPSTDLAEFPMELARKLAEAYPRTSHPAAPPKYTR